MHLILTSPGNQLILIGTVILIGVAIGVIIYQDGSNKCASCFTIIFFGLTSGLTLILLINFFYINSSTSINIKTYDTVLQTNIEEFLNEKENKALIKENPIKFKKELKNKIIENEFPDFNIEKIFLEIKEINENQQEIMVESRLISEGLFHIPIVQKSTFEIFSKNNEKIISELKPSTTRR